MVLEYLGKIPRHVIHALIFILTIIPLLTPLNLPLAVSDQTKIMFDDMQALEGTGGRICFFFDQQPLFWGEQKHLTHSVLQHIFLLEDVTFVSVPMGNFAPPLFYEALEKVINPLNKQYGVDWVQFPWMMVGPGPGNRAPAYGAVASNWAGTFTEDENGTPVEDIPVLQGIDSLDDFDIIIFCEQGGVAKDLARIIYPQHPDKTFYAAIGASAYPGVLPYIGEGNVFKSALVSTSSAAEYQQLVGGSYSGAVAVLDSLSLYHLLTVILIIFANVAFHTAKWRKGGVP